MKFSHYFISWSVYSSDCVVIAYGCDAVAFSDTERVKELLSDTCSFCLNIAKKHNKNAVGVHVLSFNQA